VCLPVCVSVTRRYCIKTAKHRITQTAPCDSPGTLVFSHQKSLVEDLLPPDICAQSDPPPIQTAQFQPIFAHSAVTVRAAEKNSISTNRKSTTLFPTSHRWTVYVTPNSPKDGTKRDFAIYPVNFNFCRKTSATKFLCVKTSSGRVVATSLRYLTVHRCIAGDVPIYLKFAFKVTHPRQKMPILADFA